jgi:hypothetical protein
MAVAAALRQSLYVVCRSVQHLRRTAGSRHGGTFAGRVLYGCFKPDIDGDAPRIVLVGDTPKVMGPARQFRAQGDRSQFYIPIFIRRARKEWVYVGDYKAVELAIDIPTIKKHNRLNRQDVTGLLFLELSLKKISPRRRPWNCPQRRQSRATN